jgi:SAM-dependent methyltransferase
VVYSFIYSNPFNVELVLLACRAGRILRDVPALVKVWFVTSSANRATGGPTASYVPGFSSADRGETRLATHLSVLRRLRFSLWYFAKPPWDTGISPPQLLAFIESHSPGRAIDLGCGTGTNVVTLAQRGWQVIGVDFAPNAVRRARRKLRRAGVRADVLVGDVTQLAGISGPFDFALDLGCFHGLNPADRDQYLARLDMLLGAGGHWLLYGILKADSGQSRFGLTPKDLQHLTSRFRLISREDGFNRNRLQPAAYLLLQKPST